MHLNEYQALALRTAKMYPTMAANLSHAALGLATEFLEVISATMVDHVKEEVGDFCWYIPLAAHSLGLQLGDLVAEAYSIPVDEATANYLQGVVLVPGLSVSLLREGAKPTGDFITMVKRVAIYDKLLTDGMRAQARLDIVGMIRYAATVSGFSGFTLAAALRDNIAKLKARFPDKFSNEAAEARADKGGADARNS
ncbi:MAG: hypothetical protein ACSLE8_06380 [Rhodococcus sp. (in: high G+C Gram-positive bacteria)]